MARVTLLPFEDEGPEGALERAEWVEVGTVYLGLCAHDLGKLWNRARMRGARRVVLEVSRASRMAPNTLRSKCSSAPKRVLLVLR